METPLEKKDLIYPDLCYRVIGALFEVYNSLGYGYKELYYQRAIANNFSFHQLPHRREVPAVVKFRNKIIGKISFDFLIDEKLILEIKKTDRFSRGEIEQVSGYLKASGLKLGIIAHFTKSGIKFKRILNLR